MTTFSQEYINRLADIEKRAQAVGSNITVVCRNTGIARATVERGRERPPQSIAKIDQLTAEVVKLEKAYAKTGIASRK
jgi:hypothetical protein